jgi:hypothetical protein
MFANLLGPGPRRNPLEYERRFVESVHAPDRAPRNRRTERLLVACWIVILLKCALVAWAVPRYHVPFSPLWVILPTLLLAGTVTALYIFRD